MKKIALILLVTLISIVGLSFVFFPNLFVGNLNLASNSSENKTALPIPTLLEDINPEEGMSEFNLVAQVGQVNFIEDKLTSTLGYNGNFLGPVIRVNRYDEVTIHVQNKLSESTSVHFHGLEVDGPEDGGPYQMIEANGTWDPTFIVDQAAATLWFHPHVMGTTATQVYEGLAGLIIVDDENSKSLNLPDDYGINDIPLILQDRTFDEDGQFIYIHSMDGAIGNQMLVNGAIDSYLDVNQVKMRFRLLNGSNARNFNIHLSNNAQFVQIASDGGFLEEPVNMNSLTLAPGERAEIIVDFSTYKKGDHISLLNDNFTLVDFNVQDKIVDNTVIPSLLATLEPLDESLAVRTKKVELDAMGMFVSIDGKQFDPARIDTEVNQNEYQIWEVSVNSSMMSTPGHPFHIHSTQFRILSINGEAPPANLSGYKDTVYIKNGDVVRLLVQFKHKGLFMYHCHILEHEESGMMATLLVN